MALTWLVQNWKVPHHSSSRTGQSHTIPYLVEISTGAWLKGLTALREPISQRSFGPIEPSVSVEYLPP
jgi:hypothetical protein